MAGTSPLKGAAGASEAIGEAATKAPDGEEVPTGAPLVGAPPSDYLFGGGSKRG